MVAAGHRWATSGRWCSPFVKVDGQRVCALASNRGLGWTAAIPRTLVEEDGPSWSFQTDDCQGIWFGMALRDCVPHWRVSCWNEHSCVGSDVGYDAMAAIFGGPHAMVHSGVWSSSSTDAKVRSAMRRALRAMSGPVRLAFAFRDGALFVRVNGGGAIAIATGVGAPHRWTPYVTFSASAMSRGASVELLDGQE